MSTRHWSRAVLNCERTNQAYVLLTLLGAAGSSPRDHDAKMVVTATESFDTLGGGRLEFDMIKRARELLLIDDRHHELFPFSLGPSTGQCCGGKVTVLLEVFPAEPFILAVFGAGHIAQRLMPLLDELPGKKYWVDTRQEWLDKISLESTEKVCSQNPVEFVKSLPDRFHALVLTHDHSLDYALVRALLRRNDGLYVGLIASKTKAAKFSMRLREEGLSRQQLAQLRSPVGLAEVPGKLPVEVAVSIAAELIQMRHRTIADRSSSKNTIKRGLSWSQVHAI